MQRTQNRSAYAPAAFGDAGVRRVATEQRAAEEKAEQKAEPKQKKRLGRIDMPLLSLVLILLVYGLVMLYSASYPTGHLRFNDSFSFIKPQLGFAVVGLVGMFAAALFDYHWLKKFAWPLMLVTLFLLVVVLFMPEKNGAQRWIWLNSSQTQSIQPSELAKFALILLFSALIAANQSRIKTFKYGFLPFVLILGTMALLLIQEPHLSCTILVLGIGGCMMFAGGTSMRWLIFTGALALLGLYVILNTDMISYASGRIDAWRDPFSVDDDLGHQIVQSLIAVGSGGAMGRGIGNSVQKFLYLPEMYNDYIFAVLCEELGFIGALSVIILFILLLVRGLYIAVKAKDKFGSMLVVGISVQIALQAMLHIAVNTNSIPSTGISMPFFSSGGSSLVMLLGQVGIMLSVSRQADIGRNAKKQPPEADLPKKDAQAHMPVQREG